MNVYRRLLREAVGAGDDDLRSAGLRVSALLEPWPDLRDEIEGIAQGAEQDPLVLLAINARTEMLAPAQLEGECSVIGLVRAGALRLAQTWDWHPDLARSTVVVTHGAAARHGFTTVTEAGILAKLGLNEAGVAVGLNFLTCTTDGGLHGVPIHILMRLVLERCGSALEALSLLTSARTSASSCITVAAAEREAVSLFAVELSPGGAGVVWPDRDGRLVHTNHFLLPPASGRDVQPTMFPSTLLRQEHITRALRSGEDAAAVLGTHFPQPEGICRHASAAVPWGDRRATLLCFDVDPVAREMKIAAGPACSTTFEPVRP